MNTATATVKEIDAALAALYGDLAKAQAAVTAAADSIHYAANDRHVGTGRSRGWKRTLAEAMEDASWVATSQAGNYLGIDAQKALDAHVAAVSILARVRMDMAPLNEEFDRRGGWTRFFMVPGGHIHSSMNCSTCHPTTQFGWLPELSGDTEADAVKAHGALLCSICYPSAPVEWTNGRELEAAAKAAANCSGSGSYYDSKLPNRTGFYSGNWATCPDCGGHITITSTGKLRSHKAA